MGGVVPMMRGGERRPAWLAVAVLGVLLGSGKAISSVSSASAWRSTTLRL
ncbi:hypothetical protein VITFI_CDS3169 [Vitreoscilla filiformis]|uniref:Uncharacterized protein n=1 Tax=Vitreoscilla filiformis TaxID=63 RepID=A0A221KIV1_VITFI|nr:hypothetical protein VITFI_CDS3169 [Vitreoscilla filiformis]